MLGSRNRSSRLTSFSDWEMLSCDEDFDVPPATATASRKKPAGNAEVNANRMKRAARNLYDTHQVASVQLARRLDSTLMCYRFQQF
jgi:hypothetical protein